VKVGAPVGSRAGEDGDVGAILPALFVPYWPPGNQLNGIVTSTARMVMGYREIGVEPVVVATRLSGTADGDVVSLSEIGVEAPLLRAGRLLSRLIPPGDRWAALRQRARLAGLKLVREGRASVFEVEESFGFARELLRLSPVPVVIRLRGPWFLNGVANGAGADADFGARVNLEGRLLRSAVSVTAPSGDVLVQTERRYGLAFPHSAVIPNAAEIPPVESGWRPATAEPGHVLFVGRFDRHKGGDVVVRAFALLAGRWPGLELSFAGPSTGCQLDDGRVVDLGPYIDETVAPEHRRRIRVLGPVAQSSLPELRRRAAVTVVASRYEVFGNVVVEAAAMGCPLVASGAGGIAEIVRDGETGLLVEPGDAESLANGIERLLADPALAARLGERARADCVARFSAAAVARRTLSFYAEAIERWRACGRGGRVR
jgi:glycosyltransferase involved in cell wall biosynthesis